MEVLDTEEQGKVGLLELTAETKNQASGNKGKGDIQDKAEEMRKELLQVQDPRGRSVGSEW